MLNSSTQKEPEAVLEQCSVNNESAIPDVEDCSTGHVPHKGERELIVPDFNSMFKYMFNRELGNKRLEIYTFLNRLMRVRSRTYPSGRSAVRNSMQMSRLS